MLSSIKRELRIAFSKRTQADLGPRNQVGDTPWRCCRSLWLGFLLLLGSRITVRRHPYTFPIPLEDSWLDTPLGRVERRGCQTLAVSNRLCKVLQPFTGRRDPRLR
jgi:hypothetical protein